MLAVKIETFEGPLDLLLRLIEQEQLDITEVSLGRVTDQYLQQVQNMSGERKPDELSDFLVVAAKLVFIKSKSLLPQVTHEEEEEIEGLQRQLKIYQEFAHAAKTIETLFMRRAVSFARPYMAPERVITFAPPPTMSGEVLATLWMRIVHAVEIPARAPRRILFDTRISIQEKINHITSLLSGARSLTFHDSLHEKQSRAEIVVSFLALLELIKQRVAIARQDDLFTDIAIHPYAQTTS